MMRRGAAAWKDLDCDDICLGRSVSSDATYSLECITREQWAYSARSGRTRVGRRASGCTPLFSAWR